MSVAIITRKQPDRKAASRKVIAVDSEGWNIPLTSGVQSSNPYVQEKGWHSDVMLCAADDSGRRKHIEHDGSRREVTATQARNYGIPTVKALDFLLSLPYDATVVGFYFSYDTTKLIGADLPLVNMRELSKESELTQDEYNARCVQIAQDNNLSLSFVHSSGMVKSASTVWNGYWLQYTPRKELVITNLRAGRIRVRDHYYSKKDKSWTYSKPYETWAERVTVWDVFGFFQQSFIKALKAYKCGECATCRDKKPAICESASWTQADLEYIESMKENRGAFNAGEQQNILNYCFKECEFLSFLVRDLMKVIEMLGLTMGRWDGSGAVASSWMKQHGIKEYLPRRETVEIPGEYIAHGEAPTGTARFNLSGLPEWVALQGYFGGRFEVSEIGFMDTLYGNDINSAYPHIAAKLPCLAHGHFEHVTEYVSGVYGIYRVGAKTAHYRCGKCEPCKSLSGQPCVKTKFAPFPFRTGDSVDKKTGVVKDAIYYCHGGQRWIWQDEAGTALKHFGPEAIPVYEGYIWVAECDHLPFTDIPEMYLKRQAYVRDGNGIEKAIKLVLNSLYGKTAQSIGWNIGRKGEKNPPPFQCYIWAGMITSGCRAMILDAIMQPGADCVSIATDGILTRGELQLRTNPDNKDLGDWENDTVTDAYLFQSGVYTMMNGDKRVYKTRGFSAREVPYTALIAAWETGTLTVHADSTASRFVPMKSGVDRTDALEYIGQWVPSEHDVSFTHNRRIPEYPMTEIGIPDLESIAGKSYPHTLPDDLLSAPYSPKQTWDDVMEHQPPQSDLDYIEA